MIPHLLCCQGFAVNDYGFNLDAADLEHSRLLVAVGTQVTLRPPHRSQRALLTHWAPALGINVQTQVGIGMTDSWRRYPAHYKSVHSVPIGPVPLASTA